MRYALSLFLATVPFAAPALGVVTLVSQQRSVKAVTTFDGTSNTVSAATFDPFVARASAATTFQSTGGITLANSAVSSINCLVDPNNIRASGRLKSAGGVAAGVAAPVLGEAKAVVQVSFTVSEPTPFVLAALARPEGEPEDEFELEIENHTTNHTLVGLNETMAPQAVQMSGELAPGEYTVKYKVELTGPTDLIESAFGFDLRMPAPGGCASVADVGKQGGTVGADGLLDNNDFIVYIDGFFGADVAADVGKQGGQHGPDGLLDNNDFIVFIDDFFAGCQ